jgi:hypothetical protein
MKESTVLILVFGMVVIVILAMPSLFNAGSDWLSGVKDFIKTGFENVQTYGNGFTSLGMKIYYTDGTNKLYKSDTFSILPLKIYDSGLEVSSISVSAYATIVYDGKVNSWLMQGGFKAYYFTEGLVSKPVDIISETVSVSSSETWASKTTKNIVTFSYSASQIEDAIFAVAEIEVGNHAMYFELDATLTLIFDDGSKDSKTANGYIEWAFFYTKNNTFQSLSIDLRTTPIP